ncbi:squalene/phytoene synthase family protein [Microbacterium sp. M28]|uniref:phytoene/squalene synthase family protein n=1 Tax=Microbacterium sp. M28 TaxID=2962064 RepID=UPI0021F47DD9|nr:squalene/phytoene synthase family protein [Microbacterium sp. M28]UYO97962.1 squalene/phytoene synthase family protein [Microbacterium sp. M28]
MNAAAPEEDASALARFTRTAESATTGVIRTYSTSFGLATRLLGRRHRQHIRNVYAMVRIADEIVDGVAGEAGLDESAQRAALDAYADDTHRAMRTGYSSNIVLHAFARTAARCRIGEDLTEPFFASMRTDATSAPETGDGVRAYSPEAHAQYVYGSAEVVGLMCLRVFLRDAQPSDADLGRLEAGARQLGAAFQNVNFLRDLADDTERLQRGYLSGTGRLTDEGRDEWVRTVRAQLEDARASIPLLPRDARAAVRSALALFEALTARVARTPAATLYERRVRVPDPIKILLAVRSVLVTWMEPRR